ncbi:BtrH N-terminal domain-containing protein [Thermodesulfobacteriota bacterium]
MKKRTKIKPFKNFKVFDGYHCQTNSFAKIYSFYNSPLSEEMLLGIGSGLGFIYWHQKGTVPFMGGRDNNKNFHTDIGERSGVVIEKRSTSSIAKAEKALIEMLNNQQPVMMFVDMGFLPCFDFGEDYHFGGHTHVVCGFDGKNNVLVSEMDPEDTGLKKGFVYEMSLEQLAKARGSKFKPFPPQNAYFVFDFTNFKKPSPRGLFSAIRQTAEQMLNPPITNLGVKGIRKAGTRIREWEKQFNDSDFRMSLFNIYLFVTIAGTGGGLFRYMYGRFLKEVSKIISDKEFARIGDDLIKCGDMWTEIALPMKAALDMENPGSLLNDVPEKLNVIAGKEEQVFSRLKEIVK